MALLPVSDSPGPLTGSARRLRIGLIGGVRFPQRPPFAGGLEAQLFSTLDAYPLATISSIVVMVLVGIFFVSGADAASIVMGSLSERGTIHPSRPTVIFWGVATGAVAAVMLLVGGADALSGLQTITVIAALPFVLIMIGLAVALVKDLAQDPLVVRRQYAIDAVEAAVITGVTEHGDDFVLSVEKGQVEKGQVEKEPAG